MARSASSRPGRTLGVLVGFIAVIYGVIGGGTIWSNAQWTPKLGLDLIGGTEIVLTAVPQAGGSGKVTQETLDEAVKIIRQRINGSGVSEAEITTQGQKNIVVSLPGKTDEATRDSIKRAAALEFRAVLYEEAVQATAQQGDTGTASPTASGGATASGSASASASGSGAASATLKAPGGGAGGTAAAPTASSNGRPAPRGLLAATPSPTQPGGTASGSTGATAKASGSASPSPTAPKPTDASDLNWVDEGLYLKFMALDCSKPENLRGLGTSDLTKPTVMCSAAGDAKYILGPAELGGTDISASSASLETNSQGFTGTAWQVNLTFTGEGGTKFATVTQRLAALTGARNQFAIVLDGLVVSAPRTNEAINSGSAQITGNFTQETSQSLANQLKFGALPISFREETEQNISATLGGEQLERGLLAGLIGLILVVLYSLGQYRALGLVTVTSLIIAAGIVYGLVVLLGWRQGLRLTLPGVAGLIVSIGITADSFIVFFERVRDEVRDGRGLLAAVDLAWQRARRTILISDGVSLLAAVVLFLLAVGGVKGFAFTLGLTTVVDVLVVFLFTHPMVALLARTRFFGGGHRLSGFDAEHLGRAVTYMGRGAVRSQPRRPRSRADRQTSSGDLPPAEARTGTTIAERRVAAERAAEEDLLLEPDALEEEALQSEGVRTEPDVDDADGADVREPRAVETAGDSSAGRRDV